MCSPVQIRALYKKTPCSIYFLYGRTVYTDGTGQMASCIRRWFLKTTKFLIDTKQKRRKKLLFLARKINLPIITANCCFFKAPRLPLTGPKLPLTRPKLPLILSKLPLTLIQRLLMAIQVALMAIQVSLKNSNVLLLYANCSFLPKNSNLLFFY